jgi:integrase/recombinase XerD
METASVREASARVIAALAAAGRSRTTVKRHLAVLNAFARFLQARGQDLPTEADCLAFVAERSGYQLAGLREPASSREAQLARRPLVLLMECLDGGMPRVGQATAPLADRCPARFRPARDEYLTVCRRRNAEASVVTKQRAADAFLAYLEEAGRETLGQVQARDLAGFCARRQHRGYAPKTNGSLRSCLADFLRHLHQSGQIGEDLAGRLPPQRYPRRGQTAPYPWTAAEVRLVLDQIDRQSAIGKRDYAMIVLTARLGLKAGDLRRLELGWFDWRAKTLALTQHKTGLPLRLPVPGDVGWAVIDYIRHGRPEAHCAQVFVKHRYPFTAFGSSSSAGCRLGYYARRAGIMFPAGRSHGLHSLRGALAVAMLQAGTPPPVVTAVLGHAAARTTAAHYLRLDTEHLRRCALDVEDVLGSGQGARS